MVFFSGELEALECVNSGCDYPSLSHFWYRSADRYNASVQVQPSNQIIQANHSYT